jgi:hypothetical protein
MTCHQQVYSCAREGYILSIRMTLVLCLLSVVSGDLRAKLFVTNETSGYQLGFAVGARFRSVIHRAVQIDANLPPIRSWLNNDPIAGKFFNYSLLWHAVAFPALYAEINGMADAAGVNRLDLHLVNFESDILVMMSWNNMTAAARSPVRCSDVLSPNVSAHNEDGDIGVFTEALTYVVRTPDFTAFCYAGQLCGNAFSVNRFGMSQTMNQLWPLRDEVTASSWLGAAQNYALRSTIMWSSPTVAVASLPTPCMTGFSVNYFAASGAANVEVAFNVSAVTWIPNGRVFGHFNEYLVLNVSQPRDISAEHRRKTSAGRSMYALNRCIYLFFSC